MDFVDDVSASFVCLFVFALPWVAHGGMCREVFSTVQRDYVFVLEEKEVEVQPVSGDRALCVNELGLCYEGLEAHGFQAEFLPCLHSQCFSSICRYRDIAILLLGFHLHRLSPFAQTLSGPVP